ncbi:MAG: adenine phosphoribosyltransferase, partial [Trueperella pyogenes]|nr:adenine phosphoribosyltransferase [Trueperella pyogenes]
PVIGIDYELEYGKARMELNPGLVEEGARVLVVDDVLATGGTAAASVRLLEQCGAKVEAVAILLELEALGGRSKLEPQVKVETAVVF